MLILTEESLNTYWYSGIKCPVLKISIPHSIGYFKMPNIPINYLVIYVRNHVDRNLILDISDCPVRTFRISQFKIKYGYDFYEILLHENTKRVNIICANKLIHNAQKLTLNYCCIPDLDVRSVQYLNSFCSDIGDIVSEEMKEIFYIGYSKFPSFDHLVIDCPNVNKDSLIDCGKLSTNAFMFLTKRTGHLIDDNKGYGTIIDDKYFEDITIFCNTMKNKIFDFSKTPKVKTIIINNSSKGCMKNYDREYKLTLEYVSCKLDKDIIRNFAETGYFDKLILSIHKPVYIDDLCYLFDSIEIEDKLFYSRVRFKYKPNCEVISKYWNPKRIKYLPSKIMKKSAKN